MPTNSSNNARSFLSPSFRLGGMFEFILFLAIACSWLGCLRDVHWFLALFDHFRLQGALGCILAFLIFLWRKRWVFAAIAAFSVLINAWPLWKTSFPLPSNITADGTRGLKLICFNVLTSNPKHAEVLAYLQQSEADVIVLLEINDAWMKSLEPLRQNHPNIIASPEEHNFGLAVFSRLPLRQSEVRKFADEEVNSVVTLVEHEGKTLRIIGTHPMPPTGEDATEASLGQLQAIAKFVATSGGIPTVVLGDFNATPWSPGINALRNESTLDFRTPKPVWRPTWQARNILALPIDHALCTPPLFFEQRELSPDLGSDHRAQELLVKWAKP